MKHLQFEQHARHPSSSSSNSKQAAAAASKQSSSSGGGGGGANASRLEREERCVFRGTPLIQMSF